MANTNTLSLDAALEAQESELGSSKQSRGEAIPAIVGAMCKRPNWSATDIANAVAKTGVAKADYAKGRVSEIRSTFQTLVTLGSFTVGGNVYSVTKRQPEPELRGPSGDKK